MGSQKQLLKPLLLLSQLPQLSLDMVMDILVMDMVAMDTMVIMERDLLMLSQDMDIMAMDMAMDTMDTMARDLLRQDMDIMAMDMDMDMVMAMATDTMANKQICCSFIEFSTNEVGL